LAPAPRAPLAKLSLGGAIVLALPLVASCRASAQLPVIIQPGAPGESVQIITPEQAIRDLRVPHTAADVRFMQGMIGHHAQALEMTALLSSRSGRDDMRLLARRIELSQGDEIRMMERWLETRGERAPDGHAHHRAGATLMPGMLTPDEMGRLAASSGREFDRLFLEFMIRHHDGALTMVEELFSNAGAGQEPEVFAFVSDVEADQRIEIDRMRAMLSEVGK
jgi:uncharacterized protein (DUF305 family)